MNLYYEIAPQCVDMFGGQYLVEYDVKEDSYGLMFNRKAMRFSYRVWEEKNGSVRFAKHRYEDPSTAIVDEKEFFWVKLRSKVCELSF